MTDSQQTNPEYYFAYMIDVSDSVGSDTLKESQDALISLTQSLIDEGIADDSQFSIIPFASEATLQGPVSATEAISILEGLSGDNGFTNFRAALETANQFFSTVPTGKTNIGYFLSDGFSTTGGEFRDEATALQGVADVQAFGVGAANNQQLALIDSDGKPDIIPQASELPNALVGSLDSLISAHSGNVEPKQDGEVTDVASAPPNQSEEDNSPNNKNDKEQNVDEPKPVASPEPGVVDDGSTVTPITSPESDPDNISKLGADVDSLIGGELPVLNIQDISIAEGDSGITIAEFTVDLSSPATEDIQISYQTVDGTAVSGSDYNQESGQIVIPVGETSAKIDIEVNGDSDIESDEEFTLNLQSSSSVTFENKKTEYSKVAVIENDDVQNPPLASENQASDVQVADSENLLNGNLLDLQSFTGEVTLNFTVEREADFGNTVGFYKVDDTQGTVTDTVTGNKYNPSDGEAYAAAAIRLQEPGLELSVDNLSSTIFEDTLSGGHLYASFIVSNGDFDSIQEDFSNVYFSFIQANSDTTEHVRSFGQNTLGYEDLPNGGDLDFDDIVIRTEVVV